MMALVLLKKQMGINKYDWCMPSVRAFPLVKMIYVTLRTVILFIKGINILFVKSQ